MIGELKLIDNMKGTGVITFQEPNKRPICIATICSMGTPNEGIMFMPDVCIGAFLKTEVLNEIVTLLNARR